MSGIDWHWGYVLMIVGGIAVTLLFPVTRGLQRADSRRRYWILQGITLFAALLGAKFAVLVGDGLWPLREFHDWGGLIASGRSIVGALLFGFLAAEIAKPLLDYHLPPNDRFALILPFSLAIGRIGCLLAGCCRGTPWDGPWAITYEDGIPRHPAPVYEMLFDLAFGLVALAIYRRRLLHGRLFALFMLAYGVFRFASEFWRETAKAFGGLSAYQWMSLMLVVAGVASLVLRSRRPLPAFSDASTGEAR